MTVAATERKHVCVSGCVHPSALLACNNTCCLGLCIFFCLCLSAGAFRFVHLPSSCHWSIRLSEGEKREPHTDMLSREFLCAHVLVHQLLCKCRSSSLVITHSFTPSLLHSFTPSLLHSLTLVFRRQVKAIRTNRRLRFVVELGVIAASVRPNARAQGGVEGLDRGKAQARDGVGYTHALIHTHIHTRTLTRTLTHTHTLHARISLLLSILSACVIRLPRVYRLRSQHIHSGTACPWSGSSPSFRTAGTARENRLSACSSTRGCRAAAAGGCGSGGRWGGGGGVTTGTESDTGWPCLPAHAHNLVFPPSLNFLPRNACLV